MGKSNLLALPPQAKSHPSEPEENPLLELRRRRAVTLVPTVRATEGGFRVSSSSREIRYLVTQPNGHLVCTCPDFWRHEDTPGFKCKHVMAVEMAQESGQVSANGNGHAAVEPTKVLPSSTSVLHRYLSGEDPVRLKLIKNTKGYSWEISVAEKDPDAALAILQDVERKVKEAFGDNSSED